MTEDERVGWHQQLDGHEFEHVLEVGEGQGSLVGYSTRVAKSRTRLSDFTSLHFTSLHFSWLKTLKKEILFYYRDHNTQLQKG